MTRLEKRQMILMDRYQKQGLLRFVLIKGALAGLAFAVLLGFDTDNSASINAMSWPLFFVSCFAGGFLLAYIMWFFVLWYFAKIKKKLQASGELPQTG